MAKQSHLKDESPTALPSDSLVPLESVLCTEELDRRPSRPPDYETENRALAALVQALADSPRTILQTLADKILEVFKADSAGISLLTKEDGGKRFYWPAIAGVWKPHIGGGTPRDFGPCGDVLDRNAALLFRHFERRYTYFLPVTPPVEECLLVPFYVEGKAVGTIWAITHDDRRKFDAEDLRELESLGRFASAAYQAVEFLDALEQRGEALRQSHIKLAERMTELQKTDTKAQNSRRAALNLMEDAVQSRQAIERLNAELRESEERFRSLVSVITDVPWTADPEGQFITPQAAWEAYTGQTWEQHRSFGWVNALHPEDRERVKEIWNDACVSRTLYQAEGRLWHAPTQRWRYFMAKATPLLNADRSVREWVGTCTDVDEQKRAHELLANTVAERTGDLQQANAALLRDMEERKKLEERLLQAQKMESIGVLAGGIAHDFNNILNIIQAYAFLLRADRAQDKQMEESLTVINETVQRGSALVQQLLTLARKSTTKVESVNVNGLVKGLIALMTQTFSKTIEFSSALEADLPPITADKNQIEQALLNLCVNARDAMSDRGRLSFKTQSIDGATLQGLGETLDGRYVCIEVSDTGIGMDESIRKRIFEPFFTTKDMGQGTGLGLSVVYGIVKNHNGFINVDSKPESGTSFRLYFPVATSEISPKEPNAEVEPETTATANDAATVFLVEDEQSMLYVLEKVLLRHGYKVLKATDGEMAVEIYQCHKETIDIVLLDIGLPKMAGRDVLLKIKNENPEVKVVIASGYLEPELKSELEQAGVKYFLPKPYMPDEVVKTFQGLMDFP
jgi:two-component system cell cycle sensor histidine kinase/response regulator CckA